MQEALRTYLELAMGITDASRKRVRKVVKDAVGKSGVTADQVRTMTGDLLAANTANREALAKLVKFEVDRALGVVGLATAEEVSELTGRVRDLERQLREARAAAPANAARTNAARTNAVRANAVRANAAPAKKSAAKKAVAKKTAAAARTAPASTASPAKTTPKRTAKTTAKKTVGKKAPAKKAQA